MPAVKVPLVQAMKGLKEALGSNGVGQRDWAERVGHALGAVEEAVRQHRDALEDAEGRVVDVAGKQPRRALLAVIASS